MENIEICVEILDEKKSLTRIFNASELSEKTIKNILEIMVEEEWDGKDKIASYILKNKITNHYTNYYYSVARKIPGKHVQFEPILIYNPIKEYEQNGKIELIIIGLARIGLR